MRVFFLIKKLILLFLILVSLTANTQLYYNTNNNRGAVISKIHLPGDSIKHKKKSSNGFYFGANLGFCFANRYTAQYYNGKGINSVDSVLNYSLNYPVIKQVLIYDFSLAELPVKMKYSPSLLLGIFGKYNYKNSGILFQFNFSRLNTKDVFTLMINDPNNFSSDPVYRQEAIYGSEQRSSIDIGYCHTFNHKKKSRPFIEFGYNINDTKFVENKIKIENLEYSLVNPRISYYKLEQGGIGMGAFLAGGVELVFSDAISINPCFDIHYIKVKLGDYSKFRPNYNLFLKIVLNGLL